MKRLLTAVIVLFTIGTAIAQKPKLGKAESLFKAGKFAEAKDEIDLAVTYEKTKTNPKTFYLQGLIYAAIDTAGLGLVDNPLEIAVGGFNKSEEMNTSDKELYILDAFGFPVTFTQHINGYWTYYFNKAIASYEKGNAIDDDNERAPLFAESTTNFENAQRILPEDTNSYMYAGYAAVSAKQPERAAMNFEKAIAAGANSIDLYNYYAFILGNELKNLEKSLEVIRAAKKLYPTDVELSKSEITILIKLNKINEAISEIQETIKSDPNNAALWFTLGVMYDELMDKATPDTPKRDEYKANAKNAYIKAVEVDPSYYDAHFNLGVMVFNEARNILQEINNLGVSKADQQKERQLTPKANELLKAAMPQWEKLYELRPEERVVLETLQLIYTRLKMYDKAEKVMNELDAMDK